MAVVKINAIEVPAAAAAEMEKRFADRAGTVENAPGFLGFQLLRPVKGESRYFVVTQWESDEAFDNWVTNHSAAAHSGYGKPVSTGSASMEFEVALDVPGPTAQA